MSKEVYLVKGEKYFASGSFDPITDWCNFTYTKLSVSKETARYIYAEEMAKDRAYEHAIDKEFLEEYSRKSMLESRKGNWLQSITTIYVVSEEEMTEEDLRKEFVSCMKWYS